MHELNSLRRKLIDLYDHACRLDMEALKPGNIGLHSDSEDLKVKDFLRSTQASAGPLTEPDLGLGERIWGAVQATHQAVGTNTNLGIILLVAPLIQGVIEKSDKHSLEDSLAGVLEKSTIKDASKTYKAIRLAKPGGMGRRDDQDLSEEPTVNLLKTMKISSSWDRIADQYSNNFYDIFYFGAPQYAALLARWKNECWATTGLFLGYLARFPDSLVARKFGILKAREISDMITPLEKEFCRSSSPDRYKAQLMKIDGHLKRDRINLGTTADLTLASIFAVGLKEL